MILLDLGQQKDWEYDVRALVSSFYPGEEIMLCNGEVAESGAQAEQPARMARPGARDKASAETDCPAPARIIRVADCIPAGCTDKNVMKRSFYEHLAAETGKELPWGMLTGIRPTKLTSGYLAQGLGVPQAAERLRQEYLASEGKARLAAEISEREARVLADVDPERTYSLYVGIPFCPTTCLYCSFTSYPLKKYEKLVDTYLDCVQREIDWTAERFRGKTCLSVYIGGGTPTTLSPARLRRLIAYLKEKIDCSRVREFTVECGRPDTIDADKLRVLKELGVTRISINPQTMNDMTLARIGRRHSAAQIAEAFTLARDLGFDDINMDIILGLPGEGAAEVEHTIRAIEALRPDSLTVHALAVKRASRLKMEAAGAVQFDLSPEEASRVMDIASDGAARMGLFPYYLYRQKNMAGNLENVGFCRPGTEGLYNILIMEEIHSIVALGAGTVTKGVFPDGRIERVENVKMVEDYVGRIDELIERKNRLFGAAVIIE